MTKGLETLKADTAKALLLKMFWKCKTVSAEVVLEDMDELEKICR